ncbi:hypothetical protein BC830DRAFT_308791 [Chytriomyces sp. MP71]|nr:hypothetical protein BC830DRAFT_308791 [Chytriomyces sp. MP71]
MTKERGEKKKYSKRKETEINHRNCDSPPHAAPTSLPGSAGTCHLPSGRKCDDLGHDAPECRARSTISRALEHPLASPHATHHLPNHPSDPFRWSPPHHFHPCRAPQLA